MFRLYNTLTRTKENFHPIDDQRVGLYTCGPTVYNYAHVGNLRTYIFEDVLRRVLEYNGLSVRHVMNITDVGHLTDDADYGEDKIEESARREQRSAETIARFYTDAFFADCAALNMLKPTLVCRATDHIKEQIDFVAKLEAKGFTYKTNDGIYFDSSKQSDYGKLARLDVKGLQAGSRVDIGEKKNPTDFALWKFSPHGKRRQMEWDSPWGKGFPGWHIECSAMSIQYLGERFDIHCGGIDHIPVHHTNEIAQNEALLGHQSVNVWMHGEFLLIDEERMGKSKGNLLTLDELQKSGVEPLAFRYFCLGAHYRSKLNCSLEALKASANALRNLREAIRLLAVEIDRPSEVDTALMERFQNAVNDDLDMPKALALLWETVHGKAAPTVKLATLFEMDLIFGLHLEAVFSDANASQSEIPPKVMELVAARETARAAQQWKEADQLRKKIEKFGYRIDDTESGPRVMKLQ